MATVSFEDLLQVGEKSYSTGLLLWILPSVNSSMGEACGAIYRDLERKTHSSTKGSRFYLLRTKKERHCREGVKEESLRTIFPHC